MVGGSSQNLALETGRVEEHDRRIETQKHQAGNRDSLGVAFNRVKTGKALYLAEYFHFRPGNQSHEAEYSQGHSK